MLDNETENFTYTGLVLQQQPGSPTMYLLTVDAPDLLEWADVPNAKADYMAGYLVTKRSDPDTAMPWGPSTVGSTEERLPLPQEAAVAGPAEAGAAVPATSEQVSTEPNKKNPLSAPRRLLPRKIPMIDSPLVRCCVTTASHEEPSHFKRSAANVSGDLKFLFVIGGCKYLGNRMCRAVSSTALNLLIPVFSGISFPPDRRSRASGNGSGEPLPRSGRIICGGEGVLQSVSCER